VISICLLPDSALEVFGKKIVEKILISKTLFLCNVISLLKKLYTCKRKSSIETADANPAGVGLAI
jgi:hypothetical protein